MSATDFDAKGALADAGPIPSSGRAGRRAPRWPYVSQFLLGAAHLDRLSGWRRLTAAGFKLTLHPDLACTQARVGERELTLVGHALDPRAPEAGNVEIVRSLLERFEDVPALIAATAGLGGRWVLIAARGEEAILLHDALGLRQAFYTVSAGAGIWAASQPALLGEVMDLDPDPEALDYMDTHNFRGPMEYRWPAAASTFVGVRHLLPNHCLNLRTGEVRRYWPSAPLERLDLEAALERLRILLPGQLRAAARRFDLALSLTAGFDSRVVLAAAREIAARVRLVSVRQGRQPDGHADVEVPARLLRRLALPHDIVRASSSMTAPFASLYKRNVHCAHDCYGHDAEAILRHFGRRYAAVTGSGAEVGRRPFRSKLPHADYVRYTPETFAWLEYDSQHPFLVRHFAEWLAGAGAQQFVKLLDLFEWEQDYGNWLAMVQLEFDVAWREIFTPYNCREVLATLLAVPERYRREHEGILWRRYIERSWPELLSEPINPHKPFNGRMARAVSSAKAIRRYWIFERDRRRRVGLGAG